MVPLTIGVPVYNGADLIDESLACLARQTFRDFRVLIYDNASTDGADEKARAWTARDSRFEYFRQSTNIGGIPNFRDVLLAADSPWFMWRADDDLSDDDYVETLYRLATTSPGCKLAVSTIVLSDLDGGRRKVAPPPEGCDPATLRGRLRALLEYPASWFYGLWDREAAVRAFVPVCERYPFAFAADHVTLYGPVIDGAYRTTTDTNFLARIRRTAETPRRRTRTPFAVMWEVRKAFRAELARMRAERSLSLAEKAALLAWEPAYLRHVLPSYTKMARTGLRELLGIAGQRSTTWHVQRHK
jgi:glycosyltransferase involved in cell wall biosynthesis